MTNRKPDRDAYEELVGSLELLLATTDDLSRHLFWSAIQTVVERHGYQLCNKWEIDRPTPEAGLRRGEAEIDGCDECLQQDLTQPNLFLGGRLDRRYYHPK